eukprot:COSAG06_NODE_2486_length_6776_cov_5.224652_7_plen_70_part_00
MPKQGTGMATTVSLMHLGFDSMRLVLFRDALLRALQPQQVPPPSLLSQLFGEGGLEAVRDRSCFTALDM